jgi:hypothetical protein
MHAHGLDTGAWRCTARRMRCAVATFSFLVISISAAQEGERHLSITELETQLVEKEYLTQKTNEVNSAKVHLLESLLVEKDREIEALRGQLEKLKEGTRSGVHNNARCFKHCSTCCRRVN